MDAFFGRSMELSRLADEVGVGAPVTLLGTAGTGKSRLAEEFARAFDGTVAWATLDEVEALLQAPPDLAIFDDVAVRGADRAGLGALATVTRVLLTSRDVAGLPGERVIALGPLPSSETRALLLHELPQAPEPLLEDVARLTEGLPGAIALVTHAARRKPLAEIVGALREAIEAVRSSGARLPRSRVMEIVRGWSEGLIAA